MSIVDIAQHSMELEQHAVPSTEGALKNTQSEGVGGESVCVVRHLILMGSSIQDTCL